MHHNQTKLKLESRDLKGVLYLQDRGSVPFIDAKEIVEASSQSKRWGQIW